MRLDSRLLILGASCDVSKRRDRNLLRSAILSDDDSPVERSSRGFRFGPVRLIPAERLVLKDGRPVPLTPKAFDLLAFMAAHPGRLLTKDELMQAVWPDAIVEESNLCTTSLPSERRSVKARRPSATSKPCRNAATDSFHRWFLSTTTATGLRRTRRSHSTPSQLATTAKASALKKPKSR